MHITVTVKRTVFLRLKAVNTVVKVCLSLINYGVKPVKTTKDRAPKPMPQP